MTVNVPRDPAELLVVKLGGTTLAEQRGTLAELASLATAYRLIVVHGGGRRLTDWLERLAITTRFDAGLRVTDDQSLEVAAAVLGGLVNSELVATLRQLGTEAAGVSGIDGGLLIGRRAPRLGRVATVEGVRPAIVEALLGNGFVPVVAPLALDEIGSICNVNADDVAAGLAAALHARLVLLTDTDGVRGRDGRTMAALDEHVAEELIRDGVIVGGMVPKVRGALHVLGSGAREVIIADGRQPSALHRALEDDGFGTRLHFSARRHDVVGQ